MLRTLRFSCDMTSLVFCSHCRHLYPGEVWVGRDRGFRLWFWGIPLPLPMPSGGRPQHCWQVRLLLSEAVCLKVRHEMIKGVTVNLFQFLTSFLNIPAMAALPHQLVVPSTCRRLQAGAPARAGLGVCFPFLRFPWPARRGRDGRLVLPRWHVRPWPWPSALSPLSSWELVTVPDPWLGPVATKASTGHPSPVGRARGWDGATGVVFLGGLLGFLSSLLW